MNYMLTHTLLDRGLWMMDYQPSLEPTRLSRGTLVTLEGWGGGEAGVANGIYHHKS